MASKYAILILAAGGSSRLGRPKQLVTIDNETLIHHTLNQALQIPSCDVHLVLGSQYDLIRSEINADITIHQNLQWELGMGNTIAFGMNQLMEKGYDTIILTVCDQPYLQSTVFLDLINCHQGSNSNSIILSKYETDQGPPTLFPKLYFEELSQLDGDNGAKSVIKKHAQNIQFVDFKLGHIDIDTKEDIENLL